MFGCCNNNSLSEIPWHTGTCERHTKLGTTVVDSYTLNTYVKPHLGWLHQLDVRLVLSYVRFNLVFY